MKAEQQQQGAAAPSTGSSPDPPPDSLRTLLNNKKVDLSNETTKIAVGGAQSSVGATEATQEQSRATASSSTLPASQPVAASEGIGNSTFKTAAIIPTGNTAPQSQPANQTPPTSYSPSRSPRKPRPSPSRTLPKPKPPAVTLYDPKKSTHCTIHHPTLEELQSHSFTDYIRNYVLPAASVRYEDLKKNGNKTSQSEQQCASQNQATTETTTEDPFQKLSDPMKLREGIAKIVLPAGFESQPLFNDRTGRGPEWQAGTQLGDWEITSPIQQNLLGVAGVYEYTFTDQRPITMAAFRDKADAYRKQQVGCAIEEDEKFFLKNENGERTEQWTQERLDALERLFWRRLGPTMPPAWYGADQSGSLFGPDDPASGWSVAKLDSCLHVLHDIPGVTSSYLYAGMWASVFAAHTEDMNLLSINYLHAGQPKFWYAVAEPDAARFLTLAQFQFSLQAKTCPEFLRHKRCLLSPAVLKKAGIRYQTAVQYPGEAMITFPASYHFGFNMGFNVAEATNFGVPEWLPFGRQAKICLCRPHSVRIDMNRLTALLERHQQDQKSLRRGNRLSWKEWGRKREEKMRQQEEDDDAVEEEDDVARSPATGEKGSTKCKNRKAKLSEQQRKKEFWVEVMKPLSSTGALLKEGKGNSKKRGKKKRQKKDDGEEIWHLAKPIGRKGLEMDARVLCMAPGTTTWTMSRQQTARKTQSSLKDEDSDEEEQCFLGQVVEISEGHVRIHIDGLPKSEDIWRPMNSSKLFLDGGRWDEKANGIPELHYWQEIDSKRRCV